MQRAAALQFVHCVKLKLAKESFVFISQQLKVLMDAHFLFRVLWGLLEQTTMANERLTFDWHIQQNDPDEGAINKLTVDF